MSAQFYSLKALKARVESLIEEQGEDAPCAGWIYTSNDVCSFDDNGDEVFYDDETTANILINLQDYDHIHAAIYESIEEEIKYSNLEIG